MDRARMSVTRRVAERRYFRYPQVVHKRASVYAGQIIMPSGCSARIGAGVGAPAARARRLAAPGRR
jgi:hypothetical protein